MKKKGIIYVLTCILIVILSLILAVCLINKKLKNKEFNYDSSMKKSISILHNNKTQLSELGKTVYDNKNSIKNPIDEVSFVSYSSSNYIDKEYVQFDIGGQGMLGGQYYGIIYSKEDIIEGKKRKVYHEEHDNNIFIYEKIENNWYFYYFDYDGETNIKEK